MIDRDEAKDIEQWAEEEAEGLATLWHCIWYHCLERGFAKEEAMELLKTYIMATEELG